MYIYSLRMLRDIRFIRTKYQLHKQAKKKSTGDHTRIIIPEPKKPDVGFDFCSPMQT